MMARSLDVALVVEDVLSLYVMEKVMAHTKRGFAVVRRINECGVDKIRLSLSKYRNASHALAHVVLVDLDKARCASQLREQWGTVAIPEAMLFRVAVREVEAWVLADRAGFASFVGVPQTKVTLSPESLPDPKQALINLVRQSRNRRLVAELVPAQGTSMSKGPLYNERLGQFVREKWDVAVAMQTAPSLDRTVNRLQLFLK
jgi:hypothetical protein